MQNSILKALENEGQVPCWQYLSAKGQKKKSQLLDSQESTLL